MAQFIRFKFHRICLIFILFFSTLGCDQVSKILVRDTLANRTFNFLGGVIQLQHSENPGAFLSLGANLPYHLRFWIFTLAVAVFLLAALVLLLKKSDMGKWQTISLTLIAAGGIGNLLDRAFRESVTDFLYFELGWIHTGIFNLADVAIVAGVMLLTVFSFRKPDRILQF